MEALVRTSDQLTAAKLPAAAPPAFLTDENRQGLGWMAHHDTEWFDNRSFIAKTDLPSADLLKQHGLSRIVLIQRKSKIQADLREVLLWWQKDGMTIARQETWAAWEPRVVKVRRPWIVPYLWHRLMRRFGYRRNVLGFFGELAPPSGS
jgi:hypothetical protein